MNKKIFANRKEAGLPLSQRLQALGGDDCLVLSLPRGGVVVGFEIAKRLRAPLDTVVARKLTSPAAPEYAFGAIAPGDVVLLDQVAS